VIAAVFAMIGIEADAHHRQSKSGTQPYVAHEHRDHHDAEEHE